MAYGYNLQMTPLQTLAFYNAIANDGEMVKPRFIKAVKEFDREIETFDKEVINQKICSDKTLREIQKYLKMLSFEVLVVACIPKISQWQEKLELLVQITTTMRSG